MEFEVFGNAMTHFYCSRTVSVKFNNTRNCDDQTSWGRGGFCPFKRYLFVKAKELQKQLLSELPAPGRPDSTTSLLDTFHMCKRLLPNLS